MSRVTVRERLSKRAVMKGRGLRWVCPQQRGQTPKGTQLDLQLSLLSKTQTVTVGCVSRGMGIEYDQMSQGWRPHRVSKIEV